MWVLRRNKDGLYVAKPEVAQLTGHSYTRLVRNAKKYNSKEEAIADSCVENETPIQVDPYQYFK